MSASLSATPRATAAAPAYCPYRQCAPATTSDGYRYTYSNGVFHRSAQRTTALVGGVRLEHFYQLTCTGNETLDANGNGADHNCAAAATTCPPGEMQMWTFTRTAGTTTSPLRQPGGHCVGVPKTVPLADARTAFLRYLKDAHLPQPTINTAPPARGLVNLPQIFATTDHPPVTLTVTVPLPAKLTAQPHYSWDYGDGTTGPDTPGTPYTPGILPADHPDHYLTHTYRTNTTVTPTLTVTWKATFTVTGIPNTFTIPDIPLTTSRTLPIAQAHSQLLADP